MLAVSRENLRRKRYALTTNSTGKAHSKRNDQNNYAPEKDSELRTNRTEKLPQKKKKHNACKIRIQRLRERLAIAAICSFAEALGDAWHPHLHNNNRHKNDNDHNQNINNDGNDNNNKKHETQDNTVEVHMAARISNTSTSRHSAFLFDRQRLTLKIGYWKV